MVLVHAPWDGIARHPGTRAWCALSGTCVAHYLAKSNPSHAQWGLSIRGWASGTVHFVLREASVLVRG